MAGEDKQSREEVLTPETIATMAIEKNVEDLKKEQQKKQDEKNKKDEDKARMSQKYGSGARFGIPGQSGLIGLGQAMSTYGGTREGYQVTEKDYGGEGGTKHTQFIAQGTGTLADNAYNLMTKLSKDGEVSGEDIANFTNSFPNLLKAYNDDPNAFPEGDFKALLKNFTMLSAMTEKEKIDNMVAYKASVEKLRNSIRNETISAYMDSSGRFTPEGFAKMKADAGTIVQKPTIQSDRLKSLKEQGPTEQALPEFPEEDGKILAKMISASFATAMKTVALAAAPSNRSAMIGAIMEDPGIRVMSGVAPMLATDIAAYKQRKEQIEDKNIELYERYQGRLDEAMAAFDAESNAAEREYSAMITNTILNQMNRADRLFMTAIDLEMEAGRTGAAIDAAKQGVESRNVNAENQFRLERMRTANEIKFAMWKMNATARANGTPEIGEEYAKALPLVSVFSADYQNAIGTLNVSSAVRNAYPELNIEGTRGYGIHRIASEAATLTKNTIDDFVVNNKITVEDAKKFDNLVLRETQKGNRIKKVNPTDLLNLAKLTGSFTYNGELAYEANSSEAKSFKEAWNRVFAEPSGNKDNPSDVSGSYAAGVMTGLYYLDGRVSDAKKYEEMNKNIPAKSRNPQKAAQMFFAKPTVPEQ